MAEEEVKTKDLMAKELDMQQIKLSEDIIQFNLALKRIRREATLICFPIEAIKKNLNHDECDIDTELFRDECDIDTELFRDEVSYFSETETVIFHLCKRTLWRIVVIRKVRCRKQHRRSYTVETYDSFTEAFNNTFENGRVFNEDLNVAMDKEQDLWREMHGALIEHTSIAEAVFDLIFDYARDRYKAHRWDNPDPFYAAGDPYVHHD